MSRARRPLGIVSARPFRRLSVDPLLDDVRRRHPHATPGEVAAILGVTIQYVATMRRRGITIWHADALAITAGTHPALIWPSFYGVQFADELALFDLDATA